MHYFVPRKQTNKKIYIRKKDHPLNWTFVSARNESRIMRLAKQTTTKSQDKNHVTFSSSSLCLWLMQNMLINTQTGTFCSLLCTLFGDVVLIRTGTLIATSRARKPSHCKGFFFFSSYWYFLFNVSRLNLSRQDCNI